MILMKIYVFTIFGKIHLKSQITNYQQFIKIMKNFKPQIYLPLGIF